MTTTSIQTTTSDRVNGIDVAALRDVVRDVTADPHLGMVEFRVRSRWRGRTRSESTVEGYTIGGRAVSRRFQVTADEPCELLGENTAANPQELLMSALNACVMVGYVVGASVRGITLERLEIETHGELDLRGFLGIDPAVRPGYERVQVTVRIKGDGTEAQFRDIHETVLRTSPNYWNVTRPIRVDASLEVLR